MSILDFFKRPQTSAVSSKKALSLNNGQYTTAPLFENYYLPLQQYDGHDAVTVVAAGDYVFKNQLIAKPSSPLGLYSHAPTSGYIGEITSITATHPSHYQSSALQLIADGKDQADNAWQVYDNPGQWQREILIERIHQAGICGMGGAGFPTEKKINFDGQVATLIVNGAECEPYVTCDEVLMQQRSKEIILGAKAVAFIIGATQILIGIEDEKTTAIENMQATIKELAEQFSDPAINIRVVALPTRYPMGSRHQLAEYLLGVKTVTGRRSFHYDFVCHNVATLKACYDAVYLGLPLISRLITFSGNCYQTPQVTDSLIGTTIQDINTFIGIKNEPYQLVVGGSMMGFECLDDSMTLKKESIAVLALPHHEKHQVEACIRCGRCAEACPMDLLPQQLHFFSQPQLSEKLAQFNLFDCIECGLCNYVCPSYIPLVQQFQFAKGEVLHKKHKQSFSQHAKLRHENRLHRIERDKLRRQQALEEKRKKLEAKQADKQTDLIAEALARVAAKKEQAANKTKQE